MIVDDKSQKITDNQIKEYQPLVSLLLMPTGTSAFPGGVMDLYPTLYSILGQDLSGRA